MAVENLRCFAALTGLQVFGAPFDRMQRNFEPLRKQGEAWQRSELTHVTAKVVIYEAFRRGQTRSSQTPCPECS